MVQTRRRTQQTTTKSPIKAIAKESCTIGKKKTQKNNNDRCKLWVQQQKKEKLKFQPDELDSNDSDDETREINLANISETTQNEKNVITKVMSLCEWKRCNRMFNEHIEFREHVLTHTLTDWSDSECYKCLWDLCDFESDDFVVFKRHVGYHAYMTKLKVVGEQLLDKRPMPPCLIPATARTRNIIPNTDSKFVCMWRNCSYTFDMIEDYFDHARSHCVHELEINKQGNRNKQVQCKWISCKRTFNKRLKMTDHMRSHTGERFVACLNCGSTFNSYVKFYDHYRRQAINKSYKCYQCYQCFNTEELLNNHTSAHVNRIKCTECDMTCPSNAALTQHFRYRHLKERPYKCNECDYGAVTKWDLQKHQSRMHNSEHATYICEECDYTCLTMNQMSKHARAEHGDGPNVYCCHCCEREYKNGSSLSRHLIKIHGFRLPSGHRRFTYQMDIHGVYRVQTTRIESLEVSKQITGTPAIDVTKNANVTYALSEFKETGDGIQISVVETSRQIEPTFQESNLSAHKVEAEKDKSIAESKRPTKNKFSSKVECLELSEISKTLSMENTNIQNEVDSNTFMESLNLKSNHGESSKEPKNIDNFSVIKKYTKKKRPKQPVTYIMEELEFDEDGNMVKMETLPWDLNTSN